MERRTNVFRPKEQFIHPSISPNGNVRGVTSNAPTSFEKLIKPVAKPPKKSPII